MAVQLFEIPLMNVPQQFAITLSGTDLIMVCRWNEQAQVWELELIDALTGASLVACLPLVTGVDLLAQYRHLGIPGQLIVYTDGDTTQAPPTLDNLGDDAKLYYLVGAA